MSLMTDMIDIYFWVFIVISSLVVNMYNEETLVRKNTTKLMPRSRSQVIKVHSPSTQTPNRSHQKFRRRSLMMKNVRIDDQKIQKNPDRVPQTVTELRFLADLIKRKQEPQPIPTVSTKVEQGIHPKVTVEYQYYDSIVRSLISEIRNRSIKDINPFPSPNKYQKNISSQTHRIRSPRPKPQTIKVSPTKDKMVFSLTLSGTDTIYEKKITSFIQFLYKLNFSNCLYVDLSLSRPKHTYKIKVGKGNNGSLVKSLLKRRFWLQVVSGGECNFSWTQLTDSTAHDCQQPTFERSEHARNKAEPKRPRVLLSTSQEHLIKILKKQEILIANEWYQRSDNGKLSCYAKMQASRVSNHIPLNCIIGAKRILFKVVYWYYQEVLEKDPFTVLPKTFSFEGDYTSTIKSFISESGRDDKVWVVKPGENTNRGKGIRVMETKEVLQFLSRQKAREGRPYIVQQYIRPFLYNGRKFDLRHFLLITSVNGWIRAYWYHQGYIRTCSERYDIDELDDQIIHLTNDAVQKNGQKYGRYEPANKLSYSQFQRYLDTTYPHKHFNFYTQILQKMKAITQDLVRASFQFMDPQRKAHNFQLYGLDFYINRKFKPYLIECNANPCLEVNCPILERIIPGVVEHALRIGLDPLLPPPSHYPTASRYHLCDRAIEKLKYELIFDQKMEGSTIRSQSRKCFPLDLSGIGLGPQEDLFQDDGSQLSEGAAVD